MAATGRRLNGSARRGIRVIARAADVLRALEGRDEGLSLGQIAKQLDLPRSTVQRIVDALDTENFVVAATPTARVKLGPALVRIASSIRFQIVETARPYMARLSGETGETVDLSILDQDKLVFLDQIPGSHRLRAVSAVGMSFPLHCSANGKALLAALDEVQLERLKHHIDLSTHTANTITSWKKLTAELRTIRKEGIAYDREEHSAGISAVAAVVRGPAGELAAFSIPTPPQRFKGMEARLKSRLMACCVQVQQVLGHS
jgi:DNA-binding IclR family transcriptional regulator